jgi:hypothetical protein
MKRDGGEGRGNLFDHHIITVKIKLGRKGAGNGKGTKREEDEDARRTKGRKG